MWFWRSGNFSASNRRRPHKQFSLRECFAPLIKKLFIVSDLAFRKTPGFSTTLIRSRCTRAPDKGWMMNLWAWRKFYMNCIKKGGKRNERSGTQSKMIVYSMIVYHDHNYNYAITGSKLACTLPPNSIFSTRKNSRELEPAYNTEKTDAKSGTCTSFSSKQMPSSGPWVNQLL